MIPVEKIAGGTLGNLLYYVAIMGTLLVVCTIIRLKVSFLRKAFIPASLLAGIIGMILGPHVLGVIPADMMSSIGALPSHMITVVFACMLLGTKRQKLEKNFAHDFGSGLVWLWSCSFMQAGVGALLTLLIFKPLWGTNEQFASLFEVGFLGGHGTAGGMASVFADTFNWAEGGDLGKTTATIGLLAGIFGGIAIINIAVRKKWSKVLTEPVSSGNNAAKEAYPEEERKASAYGSISQDVVEPFAFHLGIIGIAILIGRAIVWGFGIIFGYKGLPLFPFAMIGGWIINAIVQRTSLRDLFDRATFQRIQGMALELLIVGAMASISIPVVLSYWKQLLLGSIVILALTIFWSLWIAPRIFKECWFEQAIIRYGAATGVAAVGYMLLRTADPKMETEAGTIYALDSPFLSPFCGGGLITSAWPFMIAGMGLGGFTALTLGVVVVLMVVLRIFFWNKSFKYQQR